MTKKRILAVIAIAVLTLVVISTFLAINSRNHNCTGDCCFACYYVDLLNGMHKLGILFLALSIGAALLPSLIAPCIFLICAGSKRSTPISMKVKLLN